MENNQSTDNTESNDKDKRKKRLIILVIILLLFLCLLAGCIAFFLSQRGTSGSGSTITSSVTTTQTSTSPLTITTTSAKTSAVAACGTSDDWRTISTRRWELCVPENWIYMECPDSTVVAANASDLAKIGISKDTVKKDECLGGFESEFEGFIIKTATSGTTYLSSSKPSEDLKVSGYTAKGQQQSVSYGPGYDVDFYLVHVQSKSTVIELGDLGIKDTTFKKVLDNIVFK